MSGIIRLNTNWKDGQCAAWAQDAQEEIDRLTRELAEAKARALPEGWVAVPREPDEWMTQAAINYIMSHMITMRNVKTALALAIAARPDPKEPSDA